MPSTPLPADIVLSAVARPGRYRRRLLLYVATAMLVLATGVAAVTIIPLLERLARSEEAGLQHAAETRALAVGEWYRRAEDLARQIASRSQIREALEMHTAGRMSAASLAAFVQPRLQDAMGQSPDVAGVALLGPAGEPLVASGVAIPRRLWRMPAPDSGRAVVTPPTMLEGRLCIVIIVPILDRTGIRVGADMVAVDTSALRDNVMHPLMGTASSCLALGHAATGGVQFFLEHQQDMSDACDMSRPTPQAQAVLGALKRALEKQSGIVAVPEAVVAYTPVAGTEWGLLLSADSTSLYAPVKAEMLTMMGYSLAMYVACLLGFGVVLRPLAGRLVLHAGELAAMVEEKTRQLTGELLARETAEQALQQARDELEMRVAERTRKLAEANEALQTLHQRLQSEHEERKVLSRELINLLEGVRLDLSRELHDHTGQQLTTLRLQLNAALNDVPSDNAACRLQLVAAAESVDMVQRELRTIARGLRPDSLDYFGLVPSLETLIDEQRASSSLQFHFFHNEVPARCDRVKALALFRIAQEAISNVIRHAAARTVHVSLVLRDERMVLTIEDDGCGFDTVARAARPDRVLESLGLTLMRERMVQLGGTLVIESAPGQGTHVMAEVAL